MTSVAKLSSFVIVDTCTDQGKLVKVVDSGLIFFRKQGLILSEVFRYMERSKNLQKKFHNRAKNSSS